MEPGEGRWALDSGHSAFFLATDSALPSPQQLMLLLPLCPASHPQVVTTTPPSTSQTSSSACPTRTAWVMSRGTTQETCASGERGAGVGHMVTEMV